MSEEEDKNKNKDKDKKNYDLEERTAKFGEDIIVFAKKFSRNDITKRIIPRIIEKAIEHRSNRLNRLALI